MPKTTKKANLRRPASRKKEVPATQSEAFRILSLALKVEEWARRHNLTFGAALEKAMNDLVEKDQALEDPFLKALEAIPEDDEPFTEEEMQSVDQALREEEAGETIPIEEVMKKHGIQR